MTGAYVVWRLWREPDMKIMIVSANERYATKVASFIHALIGAEDIITREPVPWAELQSKGKAGNQKDSVLEFDVGPAALSKDPSVFAVGIGGQMTGGRADLIISDDIEVPNNSETEAQREKLETRAEEFASVIKPGGEVIYLGTFQSMQSIYRKLRGKGYTLRLWPARYPLKEKLHLYEDSLAPILREDLERDPGLMKPVASTLGGAPTDPERFHDVDLLEREAEYKLSGFQLQFMLDTSLSDAERYPLKTRDFIVMDTADKMFPMNVAWGSSPELTVKDIDNVGFDGDRLFRPMYRSETWVPYTGSVMDIDPSGRGADETSYIVTKFVNGLVVIRAWGGFKDGHSEATLRQLAGIAKAHNVNLVRVEGNFGDGMFSRLLEPKLREVGYNVPVEDHKVSGQKELRIINLVRPALQSHRLVLDTSVARDDVAQARIEGGSEYSALYQLTHLTEARGSLRHDDRADVLAHALDYWTQHMAADAKQAEKAAEEKLAKEFEKLLWQTSVTGKALPKGRIGRRRGAGRRV